MKLNESQYQAAREALINNSVFDNIKLWVEDGQLTEQEIRNLISEIFAPVTDVPVLKPLEYTGTNQPSFAIDVILKKQEILKQEKENEKPCSQE